MDYGDYYASDELSNINQGIYTICPYCKGKGNIILPVIASQRAGGNPTMPNKQALKEKIDYRLPSQHPELGLKEKPTVHISLRRPASRKNSNSSDMMVDLIGHQDIENPLEHVRVVRAQLISSEWNDRIVGIQGAVHLSRIEPELVLHEGRTLSRTILGELSSLRSKCVRIACQACKELFKINGFVFRPEFDEIINTLLCRAADNKQVIREEADEALSNIAAYAPIQHISRSVTKGPRHKHHLVRKSALRVYQILVTRIGIAQLMKNPNYHDVRNKVIDAGCIFLDDPNSEIRMSAKKMMKPLVKMTEFEDVVSQEMSNSKNYKRVEKRLFGIKFELDSS